MTDDDLREIFRRGLPLRGARLLEQAGAGDADAGWARLQRAIRQERRRRWLAWRPWRARAHAREQKQRLAAALLEDPQEHLLCDILLRTGLRHSTACRYADQWQSRWWVSDGWADGNEERTPLASSYLLRVTWWGPPRLLAIARPHDVGTPEYEAELSRLQSSVRRRK